MFFPQNSFYGNVGGAGSPPPPLVTTATLLVDMKAEPTSSLPHSASAADEEVVIGTQFY